ncbi:MAG TPA: nuclear transport factor 2 family protein [Allosphingosinicella sp.]|jgi:ketosteroid isomerase-like protein
MLLLAAAAAALSASLAPARAQAEIPTAIVAFADSFDRAQLAKDGAALDRMVSDDLVFIDGSGARKDKKAFIAGWTGPGERFEPIELIDRTFTRLGPNAWIVGAEVTLRGSSDGKPFASRFRFADTFRRRGGRWQAAHIQVTRIP